MIPADFRCPQKLSTGPLLDLGTSRHHKRIQSTNPSTAPFSLHRRPGHPSSTCFSPSILRSDTECPVSTRKGGQGGFGVPASAMSNGHFRESTDLSHSLWITFPDREPLWTAATSSPVPRKEIGSTGPSSTASFKGSGPLSLTRGSTRSTTHNRLITERERRDRR
ncbi:hypothetical protein SAM23877_3703 [Streptomyces ambofaciens ATCC 23877]|uniref:Uncharacterized protein n=1 Tax=Streptomyces ambofaciens (strain ATCC 23877 / 3486 / DSM 40053 / JCM 4204 / NBRC 12836 / NRRL B-2516) TaxID=278992 RepID=A0A0K2AUT0_STRA7|nr:hypothetical protein SAM23877_3703 [Streptomyces ambofaciens ATCC 23877]